MKKLLLMPLILLCAGCSVTGQASEESEFVLWGRQTLNVIDRDFHMPDQSGYYEDQSKKDVAFTWGNSMLLLAFAKAAEYDASYGKPLDDLMSHMDRYWVDYQGIGGYDHLPHPKKAVERYYDDNAWIAMGQIDAYQATGKKEYLEGAAKTIDFCLSGIDPETGGVWWREYWDRESDKTKNTCSVAPIAFACLRYYEMTQAAPYLENARSLMIWLDTHLKDSDELYFDHLKMSGRIGRRKWTYNSAMPLRCYTLLYKLTGEQTYLDEALSIAQASRERWYDASSGAVRCEAMFAFTLTEAWIELSEITNDMQWADVARSSLKYVHANVMDSNGRYSKRWDDKNTTSITQWNLLYPASTARAYWVLANKDAVGCRRDIQQGHNQ